MLDLQRRQRDEEDQQGLCGSSHSRSQAVPGRVWPDLQQGKAACLRGCALCPPRILTAAAGSISGGRGVVQLPQQSYYSPCPPGYSAGEGTETGRLMSAVRPSFAVQKPSSTVQTERELLAQHGPASAPKSTGRIREALGRCHGTAARQGAQAALARKADLLAQLAGRITGGQPPRIPAPANRHPYAEPRS